MDPTLSIIGTPHKVLVVPKNIKVHPNIECDNIVFTLAKD
jgi:hypothetical protein